MQEIYRTLARLMATDLTVMVTGESGTGKELVARALHDYGKRRKGPFVALNMAAIPRELIESELFGHERGAFTGAVQRSAGKFEQAAGGTLFLDEIGDMPPEAQTRLLRVLQEGEYTTVGGRTPIKANVRIVAATHRDLRRLIQQGLFREDLFYRLNVVPIRLPPLRERLDDIPELAHHFLQRARRPTACRPRSCRPRRMARLKQHRWPGNVRELENLVRRLSALYSEEVIGVETIEAELADAMLGARAGAPRPTAMPPTMSAGATPSTAICRRCSPPMAIGCRRTACTIVSFPRSSGRCCRWRWGQRAGTSCARPASWGSIAIRCARRSRTSTSPWYARRRSAEAGEPSDSCAGRSTLGR